MMLIGPCIKCHVKATNTFRHTLAHVICSALEPELVACGGGALDVWRKTDVQVKLIHSHLKHLLVHLKRGVGEARQAHIV